MTVTTRITRTIEAPLDLVFRTVSDISEFQKAIPEIVRVEFLSERRTGVGTRFRETRAMRGKEMATELEITELVSNERVRIVADSHGTVWDSLFSVRPEAGATRLTMVMDARPRRAVLTFLLFVTRGMVRRAIEGNMDALKAYCERATAGRDGTRPAG